MGDGGWEGRDCGRGDTTTWEVWAAVFLNFRVVHGHLDLKCMHHAWWYGHRMGATINAATPNNQVRSLAQGQGIALDQIRGQS